jgi:hypothetical protein
MQYNRCRMVLLNSGFLKPDGENQRALFTLVLLNNFWNEPNQKFSQGTHQEVEGSALGRATRAGDEQRQARRTSVRALRITPIETP